MSLRATNRIVGLTVSAATVALLIAGCTPAGDPVTEDEPRVSPGITDETLLLGISSDLSGPAAEAGSCAVAGLTSYLEAQNAEGGFEFGDGLTRKVTLDYRDDGYDPATAQTNFRALVDDGIFAYVGALGTSTNAALVPVADELEVPQVLLLTGAPAFSADQVANPWTMGLLPTYYDEGYAYGAFLAERGEAKVAALTQDDAYGEDYLAGFRAAIEDTDVEIVASASFDPSVPTLDPQIAELAASGADALLSAVSVATLQADVLTSAQAVGWLPEVFLPANTSTPASVVIPGNGAAYPAVYTSAFTKVPGAADVAQDADVVAYNEAFAAYGAAIAPTFTPHCAWSYAEGAILAKAFAGMTDPTRSSFMEALRAIDDEEAPLLDGVTVDTTDPARPAIHGLAIMRFDGQGYRAVEG